MRNIFSLKTKSIEKETPDDVQLSSRRSNETYQQWGTRWAGQTNADVQALRPALQVVILQQKKEQAGDQQLQEEEKLKKRNEIAVLDAQKESQQNNLSMISSKIDSLETEKNDKQSEIDAIKASDNKNNIATVNFWIGLFITLLLAAYLFIFYSSASYSAFFRAGDSLDTGSAIFYPRAFDDAWEAGIGPFLLVLLMPVIFLGLGFLISQFTSITNSMVKYIKITMLYVVTFIFDALLAYEISKKIYDVWAMNQIMDQPPYTMEMAFSSPEFWIIIFAGFIAYVIWGLVFDFTMDNYAEMTSNVKTIARIKNEIERIVQKLNNLHAQHAQITNAIVKIDGKIETLRNELEHNVTYNTDQIIQEVNNFFNGWIAYMTLVVKPEDEKENARSVKELAISIFK